MATGLFQIDCPVCKESVRKQRSLPCLHSFCENCLQQLVKNEIVECPLCKQITNVEHGDVKKLPNNFYLDLTRTSQNSCSVCEADQVIKPASMICGECSINLCQNCAEQHTKMGPFRRHHILFFIPCQCTLHGRVLEYKCNECNTEICSLCVYDKKHRGHQENILSMADEIKNVADLYHGYIKSALEKAEEKNKELCHFKSLLTEVIGEIEEEQMHINDMYDKLKEDVRDEIKKNDLIIKETEQSLEDLKLSKKELEDFTSLQHPSVWNSLRRLQTELNTRLKVNEAALSNQATLKKFVRATISEIPHLLDVSTSDDYRHTETQLIQKENSNEPQATARSSNSLFVSLARNNKGNSHSDLRGCHLSNTRPEESTTRPDVQSLPYKKTQMDSDVRGTISKESI